MPVEVIVAFAFLTALSLGFSLKGLVFGGKGAVADRLSERLRSIELGEQKGEKLAVKNAASETAPGLKAIRERLLHAGLRRQSDLEKFVLFQRICYSIPLFAVAGFVFFLHMPFVTASLLGVAIGVVCVVVPRVWLLQAIFKRRKEIRKYLPDTLDLLVIALEAGLSFDGALVRVAEEQRRVSTHISREFLFANQQILVGKTREEALRAMAQRAGVEEMDSFVKAVVQSNRLGTSLVKTLQVQADTLRKKRRQEIHAQILKAPVKLVFPLLLLIFPTLVIIILAPSLVKVFRHLGAAAVGSAG